VPAVDTFLHQRGKNQDVFRQVGRRLLQGDSRTAATSVLPVVVLVASTSAILVRLSEAPSAVKVSYRLAFATLAFVLLATRYYRDEFRRISRRDLLWATACGVLLGVHYLVWFESLEWTTVAASTTLTQTQVVFVAVLAYFVLGEAITRRTVAGILIALAGVAFMSLGGLAVASLLKGPDPVYGNGLALVAGLLFAGYIVISRSLRQRIAAVPYLAVVHVFATATAFLLAAGNGADVALWSYDPREWVLFAAMGLAPSFVAQTLSNWALRYVESSVVSVAYLGVPVSSSILAVVFLAEVPGLGTVVGGALTLVGIYVTVRGD